METVINTETEKWDLIITPRKSLFSVDIASLFRYKDLLTLLVQRDFVTQYKQTILGPLWFFIQPVFTTIIFTIIFGRLAKIPTDGVHPVLFYMAGITLWNYFADCINKTSNTFVNNQHLFGKVYFPRLVVPLSVVITSLLKLGMQLLLFFAVLIFFRINGQAANNITHVALLLPVLIILSGLLGLGFGMIASSLTTKYRDLTHLLGFAVQLGMYASPVVYPLSILSPENRWMLALNPMTSIIETFKYSFLGQGIFNWNYLAYSIIFTLILVVIAVLVFNKVEKTFIDTV